MPDPFGWYELLLPAGIGVAALMVAAALGWLRRGLFTSAPQRQLTLGTNELFFVLGMMFGAMLVAGLLLSRILPAAAEGDVNPMRDALSVWAGLSLVQIPVAALVLYLAASHGGLRDLGLLTRTPGRDVVRGLGAALVAMGLVLGAQAIGMGLALILKQEQPEVGHQMLTSLRSSVDLLPQVLFLLSAVVAAPLLEEIIFRGMVQTCLLNMLGPARRWTVILVASLIFTVVHVDAVWTFALPGIFVLSVVMGAAYERTGSLLVPMAIHFAFNLTNILLALAITN